MKNKFKKFFDKISCFFGFHDFQAYEFKGTILYNDGTWSSWFNKEKIFVNA